MKVISKGNTQSGCLQHHKDFNVNKKARIFVVKRELNGSASFACFVVMAVIAMALLSPVGSNLQDIWNSPSRLTAIEADIVDINEMIRFIEDEDRIITSASE